MNKKYVLIILIIAMFIYFIITYIYFNFITKDNIENVIVIKEDLYRGQKIEEKNYIQISIRSGNINNVASVDDISNKVLNCDLKRGQILLKDYCINAEEYISSTNLKEIICLNIENSDDFVSYQVAKDSIVNVYYTGKTEFATSIAEEINVPNIKSNDNTGYISFKLLENVKIIDVFDKYGNKVNKKKENMDKLDVYSIMIEVEKEMITRINNLKNYGKFSLSIIK
jgi:SAF domain